MDQNLQQQVSAMFQRQMNDWALASKNYEELKQVQVKKMSFPGYDVMVQFNPARMVSSGAKVDKATIAKRACFLCKENRPKEQEGIEWNDYTILVNPFPIFPQHYTIVRGHEPQQIRPYFKDLLALSEELPELLLFYNGPNCGASAPDHMHFQGGSKEFMPIVNDYFNLRQPSEVIASIDGANVYEMPKNYGRSVVAIEGTNAEAMEQMFSSLLQRWQGADGTEPMMNVMCFRGDAQQWVVLVLPRDAFRPKQYGSGAAPELLVSPATVEMGGIFITPILEHFERITADDVQNILQQVTKKNI